MQWCFTERKTSWYTYDRDAYKDSTVLCGVGNKIPTSLALNLQISESVLGRWSAFIQTIFPQLVLTMMIVMESCFSPICAKSHSDLLSEKAIAYDWHLHTHQPIQALSSVNMDIVFLEEITPMRMARFHQRIKVISQNFLLIYSDPIQVMKSVVTAEQSCQVSL